MCVCADASMYVSAYHISPALCIYIYIYMCVCVCVCIYIYIYMHLYMYECNGL